MTRALDLAIGICLVAGFLAGFSPRTRDDTVPTWLALALFGVGIWMLARAWDRRDR